MVAQMGLATPFASGPRDCGRGFWLQASRGRNDGGDHPGSKGCLRSLRRGDPLHPPLRQQRAQRRGLDRLVENCTSCARASSRTRAAVGGDQDRRQARRRSAGAARRWRRCRCRRRDDSRPAAPCGATCGGRDAAIAVARSGAFSTRQPQPPSSVSMPSRIVRLVVDAQHGDAGELAAVDVAAVARSACTGAARRHRHRRPRSASRADGDGERRSCDRARGRCARRSTARARGRAPPWRPGRAGGIRVKITRRLERRDAEPGVVDVDAQVARRGAGSRPARGPWACI